MPSRFCASLGPDHAPPGGFEESDSAEDLGVTVGPQWAPFTPFPRGFCEPGEPHCRLPLKGTDLPIKGEAGKPQAAPPVFKSAWALSPPDKASPRACASCLAPFPRYTQQRTLTSRPSKVILHYKCRFMFSGSQQGFPPLGRP